MNYYFSYKILHTYTMRTKLIYLLIATFICSVASAKTIYYDPDNGNDDNDGTSWTTAKKIIKDFDPNIVAGDTIYVKGGTMTFDAFFLRFPSFVACYGGFSGAESNYTQRERVDIDGNGIVEPWEFKNPSILKSSNGEMNQPFYINPDCTIDGFTFTHSFTKNRGEKRSKSIHVSERCIFNNNTVKGCVIINSDVSGVTPYGTFCHFNKNSIVSNSLFEENDIKFLVSSADNRTLMPFIEIGQSTSLKNCIIRNNKVEVDYDTYNYVAWALRGMLVTIGSNSSLKNTIVHNNQLTANVANASLISNTYATGDSILHCTIVNNKSVSSKGAPFAIQSWEEGNYSHYIANNFVWNNVANETSINNIRSYIYNPTNMIISPTTYLISNYSNGVNVENDNVNFFDNMNDVADSNTGVNAPNFINPTSVIGITPESTKSNWKIKENSYLIGKGIEVNSNPYDKSGNRFSYDPAIGAYEYYPVSGLNRDELSDELFRVISVSTNGVTTFSHPGLITVYSISGSIIKSTTVKQEGENFIFLPKGAYLLNYQNQNGKRTHKVLIH